jgi:hypothetical protein
MQLIASWQVIIAQVRLKTIADSHFRMTVRQYLAIYPIVPALGTILGVLPFLNFGRCVLAKLCEGS